MGDELPRTCGENSDALPITHALDEATMLADRIAVASARTGPSSITSRPAGHARARYS